MDFWRRSSPVDAQNSNDSPSIRSDDGHGKARQISRNAPYLRRYARALTGSQSKGDVVVQGTLEDLLCGQIKLRDRLQIRPGLYAALHENWTRSVKAHGAESGTGADLHLQTLGEHERAALLLTTMEGFTPFEAAEILNCPLHQIDALLESAEAALRLQLEARVLIIEDEPIIGLDLTRLARELGHDVVGVAATRSEAVTMAQDSRPGLVLADVRLADGSSGMDAAADILGSFDIPVIFITAFPEHLLTGGRPEPAFLITKPFREDTVKALIGQALFFHQTASAPLEETLGTP